MSSSPVPGSLLEDLRLIYHSPNRVRAEQALYRWLSYCADADIPELTRLATCGVPKLVTSVMSCGFGDPTRS